MDWRGLLYRGSVPCPVEWSLQRLKNALAAETEGSGAAREFGDQEVFLKTLSLREGKFPVDSPIET